MKQLGTKALTTKRLVLRRYTMDDVDAIYTGWANDPEVTRFLHWPTHPDVDVTRAVLQTWVERYAEEGYYNWGIVLDGKVLGNIAVVGCNTADAWAEVGYALSRAYWGQGIMTEALERVIAFLFEEVGVHRVMLKHDVDNVGSGRVMEKNGLVKEGVLRQEHLRKDGTRGDIAIYAILADEWRTKKDGV